MLRSRVRLVVCGFALLMPNSYGASVLGSALSLSGNFRGATFLNWKCVQPGDAACVPTVGKVSQSTATFVQYTGFIEDLNNTAEPLNANFTMFVNTNETIVLALIPAAKAASTTCAGQTDCTPPVLGPVTPITNPMGVSAFNPDQSVTGAAAAVAIEGTTTDNTSTATGTVTGMSASQPVGPSLEEALNQIKTAGASGLVMDSVPPAAISVAPEPVTLALTGAGLLGLGLLRGRWWRRG